MKQKEPLCYRVASSYSEQSKFSTNRGSLFLRNIHNESYVAIYEEVKNACFYNCILVF
jgi:hypothetical protein